ncbi:MAG: WecB/TagA/CpsF family glycosyltransferase, partial [Heliobacteriaceae bacterium]|nr:WecB/TagA/CpsF family glycosyltransferase [Heliobacteriaceae bacterium]
MERKTVKLQGIDIDTFDFGQALEYAGSISGQVVTINPEMIMYAGKNPEFARILREAQLVIPDGIGVEIALKILGHKVRRIAGIELARAMLDHAPSVALIGAKPQVIEKAVENLTTLNITYWHDGYFANDEKIYSDLKEKQPRLLLVALGSPRQEEFIYKAKELLPNTLMIGVGGSFDVWAGKVKRAPKIFQKSGLEWL